MNELEKIKQKLIDSADELFMRLGIKSVSMDDIARHMGSSKKTIYQVVQNKQELVGLVMEADKCKDVERLTENYQKSTDAIDEFLRNSRYFIRQMRSISPTTLYDLQKYYPELWRSQIVAHEKYFQQQIKANLERGMEEGLYRHDLDAEVISKFYVGIVSIIVDTQLFPARETPISDIIREHSSYHLNGVVNQFGRERLDEHLKKEALE